VNKTKTPIYLSLLLKKISIWRAPEREPQHPPPLTEVGPDLSITKNDRDLQRRHIRGEVLMPIQEWPNLRRHCVPHGWRAAAQKDRAAFMTPLPSTK
jgi:hypothetical protein